MPKRQHYLQTQASVPYGATKNPVPAFEKVLRAMAEHLKAVAGPLASNVDIKAVYNERTNGMGRIVWRDVLMVIAFDAISLSREAKQMQAERAAFELKQGTAIEPNFHRKIILAS